MLKCPFTCDEPFYLNSKFAGYWSQHLNSNSVFLWWIPLSEPNCVLMHILHLLLNPNLWQKCLPCFEKLLVVAPLRYASVWYGVIPMYQQHNINYIREWFHDYNDLSDFENTLSALHKCHQKTPTRVQCIWWTFAIELVRSHITFDPYLSYA